MSDTKDSTPTPIYIKLRLTQEEIIRFNLIIIDSIYTSEELEKLVEELNNMQQ